MRIAKSKLALAVGATALFLWLPLAQAAEFVDLTVAGNSGWWNGAFFQQIDPHSTGTGVIEPFLRIDHNGTEKGYNTDGALQFDTKPGHWTHALLLEDVPVITMNNQDGVPTDYWQLLLDINQNRGGGGDNALLSLDTMEFYLADDAELTGYPALGAKVFDLDVGDDGNGYVKLNFMLNPGSGWGDMLAYVPVNGSNTYLYLYSEFGAANASNDGFEEWAITGESTPQVPVPGAALLVLLGGSVAISLQRRRSI